MRHLVALALLAATAQGCLPADDRPEPGSVLVNVQRSAAATEGFVTDDGWSLTLDRFVTAIGEMRLSGDECVDYSLAGYYRLSDFTVADYAKASLQYGLGACTINFGIGPPSEDTILMAGVTAADVALMETPDPTSTEESWHTRTALMVMGRAELGLETKTFSWLLRRRQHIGACRTPAGDQDLSAIELDAGDSFVRELEVRPQELFRLSPAIDSPIEFGRIAAADADRDGSVTLEELAAVPLTAAEAAEVATDIADELGSEGPEHSAELLANLTLGSLLSEILTMRIVAMAGAGECSVGDRGGFMEGFF
jgi:hypothetical protein